MKRDIALVREILVYLEKQPASKVSNVVAVDNVDEATITEHVRIMIEAGLLDGEVFGDLDQGFGYVVDHITWSGHDFLESIRNDTIWRKVMAKIKSVGAGLTIDLVKELATSYIKKELGI